MKRHIYTCIYTHVYICRYMCIYNDTFSTYLLTEILLDLEAAIDSYDVQSDKGITKPGM